MKTFKYIEESGQTYLQCQIEVRTYNRNAFVLTKINSVAYDLLIGVETLYKIPSRGKGDYKQFKYKKVCQIAMN